MKFKIDIDDTILKSENNYKDIKPFYGIIKKINDLYNRGDIIIIETGRHWDYLDLTLNQLKQIGLKFHTLIMGKPPVDYSIDDKNLTPYEFMVRKF